MSDEEADKLIELASDVVRRARDKGADVAEASARAGWELSTRIRLGEPELVEEAGQRGVSLRVIRNQRVALTSTSDLSPEGIERCVADGPRAFYAGRVAEAIVEAAGITSCRVEPCSSAEFPLPAHRPRCEAIEGLRARLIGLEPMRPWRVALEDYIQNSLLTPQP